MDFVHGLSIGKAAAVIAAGIFLARVAFRLIWPIIIVGFLRDTDTAATWSVVTRELQTSYWPTILQTDAASSRGVRSSITWTSRCSTFATVLLSIAAIVTPLGLYEVISLDDHSQETAFQYVKDGSVFGTAVPAWPSLILNRVCGYVSVVACPGSGNIVVKTDNGTSASISMPNNYSTAIPPNITAFFTNGAGEYPKSVSSIFDIQWRKQATNMVTSLGFDNGSKYLVGDYSQFGSVLLNNKIEIIEGLIVDTQQGGIGFRNHTVPVDAQLGSIWSEDILFIQPETKCVDTNLTLDFSIPSDDLIDSISSKFTSVINFALVDRGGFINLNTTNQDFNLTNLQNDPALENRAFLGAWSNNVASAFFLNISNPGTAYSGMKKFAYMESSLGQEHRLSVKNDSDGGVPTTTYRYKSLSVGSFGRHLGLDDFDSNGTVKGSIKNMLYMPSNPWKMSTTKFSNILSWCGGASGSDYANISSVFGICGLVAGIPQSKSPESPISFEAGTDWTVPLYSCASSARAVIKTVTFQYNGTGLGGLGVVKLEEKKYQSEKDYPLWAVEQSQMKLFEGAPIWGLVAKNTDRSNPNVSFLQAPQLWLSATRPLVPQPMTSTQNFAGLDFYADAFTVAYGTDTFSTFTQIRTQDYSGKDNFPIFRKWAQLSKSAATTPEIINLMWTDIAANAVMGTKGWLSPSSSTNGGLSKRADASRAMVPVRFFSRRLRYRFEYAVPAFIVIALAVVSFSASLALVVLRRVSPTRIKEYLNRTSIGRVLYSLKTGDATANDLPSKIWVKRVGPTVVDLGGAGWKTASTLSDGTEGAPKGPRVVYSQVHDGSEEQLEMGDVKHGDSARLPP